MSTKMLSKLLEEKAKKELNEMPSQREENLSHLKDWIEKQPHLNARTDDLFLLNFLRGCKFSLQITKEKLEMYYTLRSITPEFFYNRDPLLPEIQTVLKKGILLPIETPDMSVLFIRWDNINPREILFETILKVGLMLFDICLYENPTCLITGQYIVDDFEGWPLSYLQQLTPTMCKKMTYTIQNAYPLRVKGFYMINAPSFIERIVNTLGKPLLNKKIFERVEICENHRNIHKKIPKSLIPKEYGGDGDSVEEIAERLKKKLEDYRTWFLEDASFRSNEQNRHGTPKSTGDNYGVEGSFLKLEID